MDDSNQLVSVKEAMVASSSSWNRSSRRNKWINCTYPKNAFKFSKSEKPYLPPPFIDLPFEMTESEVDQFLREQRVDELTRKLRANFMEIGDADIRDRSPPPTYDKGGAKVSNSRELRARTRMELEYARLVKYLEKHVPEYIPPSDLNKPVKFSKKIAVPTDDYPDINFMAVIVGPRGLNHKRLQDSSGCKIEIRGKGSSSNSQSFEEERMPLHVHVEGDSDEDVQRGVGMIIPLLDPSSEEFVKAKVGAAEQMAIITKGVDGAVRCSVCQAVGHSAVTCPEIRIEKDYTTIEIKCGVCGGKGHLTMDCRVGNEQEKKDMTDGAIPLNENRATTSNGPSGPIMLPSAMIGAFIGQGGSNIKRLMYESGCNIQVDQSKVASGVSECPLQIHGPPEAIIKARELCTAWINNALRSKEDKQQLYHQQQAAGVHGKFSDSDAAAAAVQAAYIQQVQWQAWMIQQQYNQK